MHPLNLGFVRKGHEVFAAGRFTAAVDQTGVNLSFTLSATVNAALANAQTKTLTLTLVDES